MHGFHSYEPRQGHRLAHDPLNSIVAPRPIGWISTLSEVGTLNLAPYSFFNLFAYSPPIIGFASTEWKDTAENIKRTREFVWNLATVPLLAAMSESSAVVAPEVNEFELAGLGTAASTIVAPPRVDESPVAFECRLTQQFELLDALGEGHGGWMTFGEVVMIHIREDLVEGGVFDTVKSQPLLRGGGPVNYFTISEADRMRLARPGF